MRWWLGAATATLALLTMGSGLLAAAVVIVVVAFRIFRGDTTARAVWPTLALCAALVTIGAATRVEVDYHAHMQVKTLHDFVFSLLHSLQWPVPSGYDGLAIILWLPWFLVAMSVLRSRPDFSPPATVRFGQTITALGGWVLVQLLATAYARGAGADFPASRYMDTLTFGAMVNALCLAWLLTPAPRLPTRLSSAFLRALSLAWLVTFLFGVTDLVTRNLDSELPDAKKYYIAAEAHMRGYLATDDPAQLAFPEIPYPSAGGIIDRLSHACVRALMPAVLRAPLALRSAAPSPFAENHASQRSLATAPRLGLSPATVPLASSPTWGSFDPTTGPASTGEWSSAPLISPLGAWLKFETAGQLGASPATLSLELRDPTTHALLATVAPSKLPGDTWRAAYVRAPRTPFVVVARDADPARWLAFSAPVEMGHLSYLASRCTKHGLLLAQLAAALAALLTLLAFLLRPKCLPLSPSPPLPLSLPSLSTAPRTRPAHLALVCALFLTVWGAKLIAIDRYGSDLPYWDQWAKEGDLLLTPWFERHELWKNLVLPHNEHRIAPTLTLNLALVAGGGQWDARVQCVASAALHAALAAGLFLWALRRFSLPWALASGLVLLLATAPPIAWENVLGGFQSQFYFLAGFTLLALHLLLTAAALSLRWWGGLLCALLALVSMGSGLLIAAPLAAVAVLRLVSKLSLRRDAFVLLLAAFFIGGLGTVLRTPTPWHDTLHAKTLTEFFLYFARCLSWPLPQYAWLAPVLWLPWLTLLVLRLRSALPLSPSPALPLSPSPALPLSPSPALPPSASPAADTLLAAGAWVLLQIAAVSFSRAGGGGLPASRYGDIAALGLIVSFLALAHLATFVPSLRRPLTPSRRLLFPALGVTWLAVTCVCVALATRDVLTGPLPDKKRESLASERSVQAFVLTDDYAAFAKSPLPFPLPDWLARILRRPDIRATLPASVRAPLRVEGFSVPPPDAPAALFERRTHALVTAGEWRSPPLPPATLAWWKIETSGPAFNAPNSPPLTLVANAVSTPVAATRPPPPAHWRAAYVPGPRDLSNLLARTDSPTRWLAFTEPVEMSALSYRTWRLAQHGSWVFAVGLGGLLIFSVVTALTPRRSGAATHPPRL